jgi:hypothetical protein
MHYRVWQMHGPSKDIRFKNYYTQRQLIATGVAGLAA